MRVLEEKMFLELKQKKAILEEQRRRQQEKQLANLQKQAEEATKYKNISDEIKKIEAGLYYLKLLEIDKEIRVENEINTEAEDEVSGFNKKIFELEQSIKYGIEKINDEDMKKFDTYQYQISLSGFLHGYYLLPSK